MSNRGQWTLCLNMNCPKKTSKASKKEVAGEPPEQKAPTK
jgi:hypothetical protein